MFEKCFKTYSSMEKIMIDKLPLAEELKEISVLKNERFSFQISYTYDEDIAIRTYPVKFKIISPLWEYISARCVGYVPSEMPLYPGTADDSVISDKPGLYPDPLYPMDENVIYPHQKMYDSLWFTIDTKGEVEAGLYDITVEFIYEKKLLNDGDTPDVKVCQKTVSVEIIDALLPKQKTAYAQWFHCDCLMSYYGVEAFSPKHWQIIENFMRVAAQNGQNVIFTPVFTPPLDTAIGLDRPTVQLVEINLDNGKYSFNFDKLERWINLSLSVGFEYFEMPHLFTQWGAKFCPKIMATVDGEYKRIFGWDVESTSDSYRKFLSKFLPALTSYLESKGLRDKTFFHYSDEPNEKSVEQYKAAVSGAEKYLEGFKCMDALSHVEFYKEGLVKNVVTPHYYSHRFFNEGIDDIWVYYCSGHVDYYSNRFFAYPLWRTRILGIQLFKKNIQGFLQWGYNFYYSEESVKEINPYLTTDGIRAFPSGDAFSVYPGPDGECLESIRIVSFHEGLQDIRALELLASLIGKEKVQELIDDIAGMEVGFDRYPTNAYFIQTLRRKVNKLIKEYAQKNI